MSAKNNINGLHAQRLIDIRPYVSFNYDLRHPLTSYQKRKIKIYYDEIRQLTARPFHVYRTKNKQRLAKVQAFAQHEQKLPQLKVAFVSTGAEEHGRVKFSKTGEVSYHTNSVTSKFIRLDKLELIKDARGHVTDRLKNRKEKVFTVLTGKFEIATGESAYGAAQLVGMLVSKYADAEKLNYHGNWLHGLGAHTFHDQTSVSAYVNEKYLAKKAMQKKRHDVRRRAKRAADKKRWGH